jgi:hypothetical protein
VPKRLSLPLIASIALIAIAGVGYYLAFAKAQNSVSIAVANKTLQPFMAAASGDIVKAEVPKGSLGTNDLTWADYESKYANANLQVLPSLTILEGQRIDQRELSTGDQISFGIVLPDERVIAVTSSVAGADLGVVQPGAVVDVTATGGSSGTDGVVSPYVKVLCISASDTGCRGVLGAGQQLSIGGSKSSTSTSSSGGPVKILLAVPASDAIKFAGTSVSLSLNTFCSVDQSGHFVSLRTDHPCQAPAGREASKAPKTPVSSPAPNGTTTPTTTTVPSTTPSSATTGP